MTDSERRILLGRVVGAFGVRGELKLESHTEPKTQVLRYQPWILRDAQGGERELDGVRGRDTAKVVHHVNEAVFKALGIALHQATRPAQGAVSTKGKVRWKA